MATQHLLLVLGLASQLAFAVIAKERKRKKDWTDCDENKNSTTERDFGKVLRRAFHLLDQFRGHSLPSEAVLRPPQPTSPSILSPFAATVATVVGCELAEDVHNESRIVSELKDPPLSKLGTILYR